ncbi:MAG: flavin reductase [Chloroflexi bacterium]|nr:flavin reductase [Chloroflexota bacterium]
MKDEINRAMALLDYGVYIVTAQGKEAKDGIVASMVAQVSFDPPLVMVGIAKGRSIHTLIAEAKSFAINLLARGGIDLVIHFAQPHQAGKDRFDGISVVPGVTESPVLQDALAFLDCKVISSVAPGDHTLFIAEVVDAAIRQEGKTLSMGEFGLVYRGD